MESKPSSNRLCFARYMADMVVKDDQTSFVGKHILPQQWKCIKSSVSKVVPFIYPLGSKAVRQGTPFRNITSVISAVRDFNSSGNTKRGGIVFPDAEIQKSNDQEELRLPAVRGTRTPSA